MKKIIVLTLIVLIVPFLVWAQRPEKETNQTEKLARHKALKNLAFAQTHRTAKALEKLSSIIDRLETKLDNSSLASDLAAAKKLKTDAEEQLALVKQRENIDLAQPRQSVQTFMKEMKALKAKLISLHKALREIIADMKKLERSQDEL